MLLVGDVDLSSCVGITVGCDGSLVTDVRSSASSVLVNSDFCGVLVSFGSSVADRTGVCGLALPLSVGVSW